MDSTGRIELLDARVHNERLEVKLQDVEGWMTMWDDVKLTVLAQGVIPLDVPMATTLRLHQYPDEGAVIPISGCVFSFPLAALLIEWRLTGKRAKIRSEAAARRIAEIAVRYALPIGEDVVDVVKELRVAARRRPGDE